jgi:capsid protein
MFGVKDLKAKVNELSKVNTELLEKTSALNESNHKMNAIIAGSLFGYETLTGETNIGDLPEVQEFVIWYEKFRLRSWSYIYKNHLANLIVTKRVNWLIGSGLLFNSRPSDTPFLEYYGDDKGKIEHRNFIQKLEYQFRNYISSKEIDYARNNNLHGIARFVDFNACGDGDMFLLMRIKNGYPNIQAISGQCIINPMLPGVELKTGHTLNEGVESNSKGEVVGYHVLVNKGTSNTEIKQIGEGYQYETEFVPVYFSGTNIKQAWLYRASDLQKSGETRSMPLLSYMFETLQHLNDYIIANAKNAQLKAQIVMAFEKNADSTGEKVLGSSNISVAGITDNTTIENIDSSALASATEKKLAGNGIVIDSPKGVTVKQVNDKSQSDQGDYVKSTLTTLLAGTIFPLEVTLGTYNSNYTASMGARSDAQYNLDITTEIIPSNQLYKMVLEMFLYLQILKGEIICPPLKKAYEQNDIITIQAITNSTFEGTKLKPIDPVKFIKSLREQLPEKIRNLVPLNTIENLVNAASGGDFESVNNQVVNEMELLSSEFEIIEPEPTTKPIVPKTKNT